MDAVPLLDGVGKFSKSVKALGECCRCRFSTHEGSDLVCRRNPPAAHIVPGKFNQMQTASVFPPVKPDMWCGEFYAVAQRGADAVPSGEREAVVFQVEPREWVPPVVGVPQ